MLLGLVELADWTAHDYMLCQRDEGRHGCEDCIGALGPLSGVANSIPFVCIVIVRQFLYPPDMIRRININGDEHTVLQRARESVVVLKVLSFVEHWLEVCCHVEFTRLDTGGERLYFKQ